MIDRTETGFAVYVHWPFCKAKCPYCDFNSHVADQTPDYDRWAGAYSRELSHFAGLTPGRTVTSVFFGGGTPSTMPPSLVAKLIEQIDQTWGFAPNSEITLEANPTSSDAAKFKGFYAAGINRVSLGLQSLNDTALRFLGRQHSAQEGLEAWAAAQQIFERASFDLMYARPTQNLDAWLAELDQALSFGPAHLSLYQLTIEPNTRFDSDVRLGKWRPMADDQAADLFSATRDRLSAAGLPAYEVSNHCAPGQESRHNLTYWRYQDYVGVGPGAHGRLTLNGQKYASRQHKAPAIWLDLVDQAGHATRHWSTLKSDDRWQEALIMGLRLAEGLDLGLLALEADKPDTSEILDWTMIQRLIGNQDLILAQERLKASDQGIERLDAILGAIVQ